MAGDADPPVGKLQRLRHVVEERGRETGEPRPRVVRGQADGRARGVGRDAAPGIPSRGKARVPDVCRDVGRPQPQLLRRDQGKHGPEACPEILGAVEEFDAAVPVHPHLGRHALPGHDVPVAVGEADAALPGARAGARDGLPAVPADGLGADRIVVFA